MTAPLPTDPSPRVALLTREYPPHVYGGAGVHVEHLAAALRGLLDVSVHRFAAAGEDHDPGSGVYGTWQALQGPAPYRSALAHLGTDLAMVSGVEQAELVHSHTWYANFAGTLAALVHGIPHVVTTHSLEPLRPWKREQLGGGYDLSRFVERTAIERADAVVAVSAQMRRDVLACYPDTDPARVHVIHNGIDPQVYQPAAPGEVLARHGIDPDRPSVVFVGRITRQKGLVGLLEAAERFHPDAQLVVLAGAPDTPQIGAEVRSRVEQLRAQRTGVVWVEQMLDRAAVIEVLSAATVFVCPSVYEPFGLVNLEAMACEVAVVASAVGGIPEIVVEGETGRLVPLDPGADGPAQGPGYVRALAEAVNDLLRDPPLARRMGRAGRRRVVERFSWSAVAQRTAALYREVLAG